jgi:hypothetical protein
LAAGLRELEERGDRTAEIVLGELRLGDEQADHPLREPIRRQVLCMRWV